MPEFSKETIFRINMISILEDIQQQYMIELQPDLRHGLKQMINNAEKHTRRFIKECDRVFSSDNQENFGTTADELRKIIDEIYLKDESKGC